jgi:hypothetical protein
MEVRKRFFNVSQKHIREGESFYETSNKINSSTAYNDVFNRYSDYRVYFNTESKRKRIG